MVEQRREKQEHNNRDSCIMVDHVVFDDLPEDLVLDILVRLPVETLCSSRFVCKSWFEIISRPDFRNTNLHRLDTTTRGGFLLLTPVVKNSSAPEKEVKNDMVYMKFMEFQDGKSTIKKYKTATAFNGKIVAACNGLVVLERNPETDGLILHNPVTRELEDIPLGTISYSWLRDSYGLAFCHVSRRYKLLHVFTKYTSITSCEIMDIGSGSWRAVDVPPTIDDFICWQNPVSAMGALHWFQNAVDHDGQCMVISMPLDDEKFKTMAIPKSGGHLSKNWIFAMGEFLGYAGQFRRKNKIEVWILRGLGGECGWEKQYTIGVSCGLNCMTALLCYGGVNGHTFIFNCGSLFCAYDDRQSQHLRKIATKDGYYRTIFPHVNSLVSWRS